MNVNSNESEYPKFKTLRMSWSRVKHLMHIYICEPNRAIFFILNRSSKTNPKIINELLGLTSLYFELI